MVIVGDGSGDGGGASATLSAFRAANGGKLWTWSAIPAPGQPGYKTWTNDGKGGNGSSLYGGGSFWESPIIDTKRNMLIVGTGNAEPWNSRGPGTNLYTDSIVALDLNTGQLKWHFQQVHHDLWDSDLPNNGVMFTGKFKVNGKMVSKDAVSYVNKVGMTFVLDRDERQAADPGRRGQGSAVDGRRRQHLADAAGAADGQRPLQPGRLRAPGREEARSVNAGIPCTTPDAVTNLGVPYRDGDRA